MQLQSLVVKHFRNIEQAELEFSPRLNIITGCNAAGKTSLLEAIHVLARAQSFRSQKINQVMQKGTSSLELVARIGESIPVGVGYSRDGLEVRIRGETVRRLSELASFFPLQLLAGNVHQLLEDGPRYRRRFLDWGLFHVEPGYASEWRRYQRALRQRNAALRNRARDAQIRAWNEDLIRAGESIDRHRAGFLIQLSQPLTNMFSYLVDAQHQITLTYRSGIPEGKSFQTCLDESQEKDREQGYTRHGIHRCDFGFQEGGADLPARLSRGQQKLLVIALQAAQAAYTLERSQQQGGLFLFDDIGAELDIDHQQRVMSCLADSGSQVFVTAINPASLLDRCENIPAKVFHVEHGRFSEVV